MSAKNVPIEIEFHEPIIDVNILHTLSPCLVQI